MFVNDRIKLFEFSDLILLSVMTGKAGQPLEPNLLEELLRTVL